MSDRRQARRLSRRRDDSRTNQHPYRTPTRNQTSRRNTSSRSHVTTSNDTTRRRLFGRVDTPASTPTPSISGDDASSTGLRPRQRRHVDADCQLAQLLVDSPDVCMPDLAKYDQFFLLSADSSAESGIDMPSTSRTRDASRTQPTTPTPVASYSSVTWSVTAKDDYITSGTFNYIQRFTQYIFRPATVWYRRVPGDGVIEHGIPQVEDELYTRVEVGVTVSRLITHDRVQRVTRYMTSLATGHTVECVTRDKGVHEGLDVEDGSI